jgi:DNA-binding transcriptional MerR regulator
LSRVEVTEEIKKISQHQIEAVKTAEAGMRNRLAVSAFCSSFLRRSINRGTKGRHMKSFFTPKEVARIIDISYRQIQYWDKTNFIKPSYRRKSKYRLYTFTDLFQLKISKVLRSRGFSIQKLRKTIDTLRNLLPYVSHPLVELSFLIDEERILVFNGEVVMDDKAKEDYISFRVMDLREEVDHLYPPAGLNAEYMSGKVSYG